MRVLFGYPMGAARGYLIANDWEETVRKVQAVFRTPAADVEAMVDALKRVPLPEHLSVWESEGGALP